MSLLLLSLVLMTSGLVGMFAFSSTPVSLRCKRREENKTLYWNAIQYFSLPSRSLNRESAFGSKKERQNFAHNGRKNWHLWLRPKKNVVRHSSPKIETLNLPEFRELCQRNSLNN